MSQQPRYGTFGSGDQPVCPRHPDRVSYVRCQNCGRPVCPECQRPAAVGVLCVDCAHEARAPRTKVKRTNTSTPKVTYSIIGLCVLAYLCQLLIPSFTARFVDYTVLVPEEPWRLLTAGFLHSTAGVVSVHLIMNMLSLWFLGRVLEPALGRWRFAAVFLVGVIGGSAAMGLIHWQTPTLGASGGIFAIGGAVLVKLRHDRQNLISMGVVLLINFVYGFISTGIAWEAHLGGLVVGLVLGLLYETGHRKALVSPAGARTVEVVHAVVTVVVLIIVVALGIYAGHQATDVYYRYFRG